MKRLKLAGIGCGGRTFTYLSLAAQMPERYEVVAAADPNAERVEKVRKAAKNPAFKSFASDADLLAQPKLADVVIIGTQDAYHVQPCIAAMEKGYDVLLEKPIATNLKDVLRLEATARRLKRKVLVCHVLRYTPFYSKVKEIVASGALGKVISLNASEGVGAWHQAHSFVRGHWAVTEKASPMLIAKSCHDLDIISWLMDDRCVSVSSFGDLTHFTAANAPAGAPARCTDGCPAATTCQYNATLYATRHRGWLHWVYDQEPGASNEQINAWLAQSPWGRCVYKCDNTAVDHQVVAMRFGGAATATFTMTAFDGGRNLEIFGTKAVLRGGDWHKQIGGAEIVVTEHSHGNATRYNISPMVGGYDGHGGGDPGLVIALYDEMMKDDPAAMRSSIHTSVQSHLIGYAAEQARRTGETIDLAKFQAQVEGATAKA
jgi:predicted dehydrogenase